LCPIVKYRLKIAFLKTLKRFLKREKTTSKWNNKTQKTKKGK
jgi:hypothetical protein